LNVERGGLGSLTKTEAAYAALRLAIEEGRLLPGDRLRIGVLERELSVSPTPIREALRLLQADGLVDHRPHRGMVVAEFPLDRVDEVYRLREVLEPMATARAVEHASDEAIAAMREINTRLLESVKSGVRADAARLNAAWHRRIYAEADSFYLQEFISRLWNALPVEAVWVSTHAPDSADEHHAIMDAIERRDATGAAELMRRHIHSGAEMNSDRLRRNAGAD
jgi:DNA-binding GntR family transcriptional regulator